MIIQTDGETVVQKLSPY